MNLSNKKYFLVLDQGTTSCRSIIYDKNFHLIDKSSIMLTQSFPKTGWIEHDPIEIWNSQRSTIQQVLIKTGISIDEIITIGIANQRETIVAWDAQTGSPIYNAIVWQDSRTSKQCNKLGNKYQKMIQEKTGLIISPYFSASKMEWILKNVPKAKTLLKQNRLRFGTIDCWLLFKLSQHQIFATDYTNASRTMLFNIDKLVWDEQLLALFKIKPECLPEVHPSAYHYWDLDNKLIDPSAKSTTPICALAGDQQASLFGQQCFTSGDLKATFGTGCFIIMNTDKQRIKSKNRLLTTIACGWDNNIQYAIEGSVFNAGTVVEWLSNDLKVLYNPQEATWYSELALTTQQDDLYFVPAFSGLGAPYWDVNARGLIIGIERSTRREHIIKAALEGIDYQVKDVISSMLNEDKSLTLNHLRIDGGLSQSSYLCEFLANILQTPVLKSQNAESSSLGVAYLAAIGNRLISPHELKQPECHQYQPTIDEQKAKKLYFGWKRALNKSLKWKQ